MPAHDGSEGAWTQSPRLRGDSGGSLGVFVGRQASAVSRQAPAPWVGGSARHIVFSSKIECRDFFQRNIWVRANKAVQLKRVAIGEFRK